MRRRELLALPAVSLTAWLLAACGGADQVSDGDSGANGSTDAAADSSSGTGRTKPSRHAYGSDAQQFGDLYLPASSSAPKGVVVVIHGGFWLAEYDLSLGAPLAASLAQHGWVAWNLEYRRVGDGGGDPATFDDVAAGIDALVGQELADVEVGGGRLGDVVASGPVVTLGHSAGGHLGTWAASRGRFSQWSPAQVGITHVISQAGVLDLRAAAQQNLGGGAVQGFLGHAPGDADDPLDPIRQVPLEVPVWCIHGDADANVPLSQSQTYVAAATAAGATAELHEIQGDHFTLIDVDSEAWTDTLAHLDTLA